MVRIMQTLRLLLTLLSISLTLHATDPRYEAKIRRTSYGIPHIQAKDFASLGFGEGYAQAEDHLCSVADQVVKARGERAQFFGSGKGDEHLRNDITMRALQLTTRGARMIEKQSKDLQDWYQGYAAGYNQYLLLTGREKVAGWCRGAEWVKPITADDVAAAQQVTLLVITSMAGPIATAEPPRPGTVALNVSWDLPENASNGWAIGKDLSAGGRGMLVANPHYPWVGSNRFWERHLQVPGKLNVYGTSLLGSPGVTIGFNAAVAWTHTVSAGKRFTFYSLDLVPGKPTTYRYGTQERAMTSQQVEVDVRQPDGTIRKQARTIWFSHYGPIVNLPGLGWSEKRAYAVRDTNWDNNSGAAQWLSMGQARSMKEFQAAHARHQGMPWVNTISASKDGTAWYTDSASTANLSPEAIALWQERTKSDPVTQRMNQQGSVLLDGSDPRFEWQNAPGAAHPGLVPFARLPQVESSRFVFNANDSFWLAAAAGPTEGNYSPLHGAQRTARSLRTRNNALTLSLQSPDQPAGPDERFSLDEMANAILSNRSLAAELLKDGLVARCGAESKVMLNGDTIDLAAACRVLAAWDGRFDLESRGAVLFREWLGQFAQADFLGKGKLFAVDFDPKDPVGTPHTLADGRAPLENLGRAVAVLHSRSIALDAPLGELQYADKAGRRMPVHGGDGFIDGLMNMQRNSRNATTLEPMDEPKPVKGSRYLTEKGYPVVHGSSFLMALEFTAAGPQAKAFLTYSESGDPQSPHFTDQTELFAKKQWRPVLFEERQIAADVKREYKVSNTGHKPAAISSKRQPPVSSQTVAADRH